MEFKFLLLSTYLYSLPEKKKKKIIFRQLDELLKTALNCLIARLDTV